MMKLVTFTTALLCAFLVFTPWGREIGGEIVAAITVLHSVRLI